MENQEQRNEANDPLNVGTHHLQVPYGPEGFLIAWQLFQGLRDQGVSLEMQDGTFVAPEVLDAVLNGPDGFGDWANTKFIIQLPDDDRLMEKASEFNAAQEAAAQAQWAFEEAKKKLEEATTAFNQVRGQAPVQPGYTDYSAGMSAPNVLDPRFNTGFAGSTPHPPRSMMMQRNAPYGGALNGTVFPVNRKARLKPWTRRGKVVGYVPAGGVDYNNSISDMHRNTTEASVLYSYLVNGGNGQLYGLSDLEANAFVAAYEAGCIVVVSDPNGTDADYSLERQFKIATCHNGNWFDDYVKYEGERWDAASVAMAQDLTPERAEQLMTSFQNIQEETKGYDGFSAQATPPAVGDAVSPFDPGLPREEAVETESDDRLASVLRNVTTEEELATTIRMYDSIPENAHDVVRLSDQMDYFRNNNMTTIWADSDAKPRDKFLAAIGLSDMEWHGLKMAVGSNLVVVVTPSGHTHVTSIPINDPDGTGTINKYLRWSKPAN